MKINLFIATLIIVITGFVCPAKNNITIWLIGDSTMSVKEVKAWPETGWGMPFVNFWDTTVSVDNRAKNGRSTKSFMEEGLWQPVVDGMQVGDYVFIQFGHNDEVVTKKTYTTEAEFRNNLGKYIAETKFKKGIPVLLTPVARRKFDSTGTVLGTHDVYAQIVREVAASKKIILIDLDKKSQALYQQLGPDASKHLFNYLAPGENSNYPEGKQDDTHFSKSGAEKIASIVLAEIKSLIPALARHAIKN